MKKALSLLFTSILFILLLCSQAYAQFSIGASLERKIDDGNLRGVPKNGIGIRIESGIGPKIPLLKIGYRIHASAFNAEYDFSDSVSDLSNLNRKSNVYDFGAALVGEIKLPFLANPYAGLGIGYEVQNITASTYSGQFHDKLSNDGIAKSIAPALVSIEENSFYYNAFVGLKFTLIPILHPFAEYRFSGFTELDGITDSPGRFQFGIMLDF
jgi:opacity protein-like surface antigen